LAFRTPFSALQVTELDSQKPRQRAACPRQRRRQNTHGSVRRAIIFGCPTHMGGPSWQFKRFADSTIRVWRPTLWRDKFAGGFTNSTGMSGDKFATLTYFWTLAMQQGMVWIGSGMKPAFAYDKAAPRESVNYIGGYGGAMATNPFGDPQKMSPADVATAAAFGQRFATFVAAGRTPNTPYVDLTRPRVSKPSAS
ncbi:flavodoxin family protein, partial [Mycolicibacterium goodii]|uniref:flavodoxin family protein n=1 Tax=Mycolicibacterium goodii TaxID=134601 RepID=UPI001BDD6917